MELFLSINLINTLIHRALMICSNSKLQSELDDILSIMLKNGYPDHVVNSVITRKLQNFKRSPKLSLGKCSVYLHLPWLNTVWRRFDKQTTSSVRRCCFGVEPRVVFTTSQLLLATKKRCTSCFKT